MIHRCAPAFFFAALFLLSASALAQDAAAAHIFAFPGQECPSASRPYQGPENDAAQKEGVIYCVFARTATRIAKGDHDGQCPQADMKIAKDDGDYIWCTLPKDMQFGMQNTLGVRPGTTTVTPSVSVSPGTPVQPAAAVPVATSPAEETPPVIAPEAAETPAAKPSLMYRFKMWLKNLFS